jgi:dephospho-CoA kinase
MDTERVRKSNPLSLRIGLTGGIGSGKSTVAGLFSALGAAVIDTDAIARRLTLPGGLAIDAIRQAFGDAMIDASGALDRERMRERIFQDTQAKRRLEGILHPLIGEQTSLEAQASNAAVKIFDVPLLVESGRWRAVVDRVLVVDCSQEVQVARVMRRSGWSQDQVLAVLAQQAGRHERLACADAVIRNEATTIAQLQQQVQALWGRWCVAVEPTA